LNSALDDDSVCATTPILFPAIDGASSVHMPINLFEEILVSEWYIQKLMVLHWIFLLHLSTGDFFSCFPSVHGTHASHVFQ
jgi:hypothetical protein